MTIDHEARILELEAHRAEALARMRRMDLQLERHERRFMEYEVEIQANQKAILEKLDQLTIYLQPKAVL